MLDDLARQTFSDGGLANAGIAHQKRVVLAATAQNLDAALHFVLTPDQRIDAAFARLFVQIDAIRRQRIVFLLGALAQLGSVLVGAPCRSRFGFAGLLGDAVGDVIDRVIAGHVAFSEEIGGMAFTLGEERDQHVCARHFIATGILDVDDRALDDALEAGGGLGVLAIVHDQARQFFVHILVERVAKFVHIHVAGAHHRGRIHVFTQREQEMLQRCVFVLAFGRGRQGAMQGTFESG